MPLQSSVEPIPETFELQTGREQDLLHRYRSVRGYTSALCARLSAEDQMVQSCPEASPTKWHQAHTSWFFETFVLSPFVPAYQSFHPDFHWLFNSYYRSLGEEIPEKRLRASFSRPSLQQILDYRTHVDTAVERLLSSGACTDEVVRRITLGLHHEQQHAELALTDIKHAFFTNPLQPAYEADALPPPAESEPQRWVEFPGGLREIGYPLNGNDPLDFCFDNETPRHRVYLQPFALAHRLVTCAEYLSFMQDDGYRRPELWLSEGMDAVERESWKAPLYWHRDAGSDWRVFTLGGWRSLEHLRDTPVCHISFFEADAYARWKGLRLPTEAEWEVALGNSGAVQEGSTRRANAPARLHPASETDVDGLSQMTGACWQWMASPYVGYPGYRPLPGALGEYNGKFMSSQVVLRGGSCVTPPGHLRGSYRNFFSPSTRWQFSGLRLARSIQETA